MERPLKEAEETDEVSNRTHSKRSTDDILTIAEIDRLESYWIKFGEHTS